MWATRWTDGGGDAELFVKFAGEGDFGGFAELDLAAGELPLEAHGLVGLALADEDLGVAGLAAVAQDEGRNNKTWWTVGGKAVSFLEFTNRFFHLATRSPDYEFRREGQVIGFTT